MSGGSTDRRLPPEERTNGSGGSRARDRLAGLLDGSDRPIADYVEELRLIWRDAQREARDAYVSWRGREAGGGHVAYLAALDREERAAEVYAEVRRRLLEEISDRRTSQERTRPEAPAPQDLVAAQSRLS